MTRSRIDTGLTVAGFVLLLLIGLVNPFGLRDAADQESRNLALKLASPFYPASGHRNILVVQFTDSDLVNLQAGDGRARASWPASYTLHAELLRKILRERPVAVFYDLAFTHQHHSDADLQDFVWALQDAVDAGVPVYVAGVPRQPSSLDDSSGYRVVAEIARAAAGVLPVQWRAPLGEMPLAVPAPGSRTADRRWHATPAAKLYYDYLKNCSRTSPNACNDSGFRARVSAHAPHMTVFWGSHPSGRLGSSASVRPPHCRESQSHRPDRVLDVVAISWEEFWGTTDPDPACFYHDTLQAYHVMSRSDSRNGGAELGELISGRIVFVGAWLDGIPDEVESPVHGVVPAVMLHAMALDNLISFQGNYLRPPPNLFLEFGLDDLLELLLLAVLVHKFSLLSRRFQGTPPPAPVEKIGVRARFALIGTLILATGIAAAAGMPAWIVQVLGIALLAMFALDPLCLGFASRGLSRLEGRLCLGRGRGREASFMVPVILMVAPALGIFVLFLCQAGVIATLFWALVHLFPAGVALMLATTLVLASRHIFLACVANDGESLGGRSVYSFPAERPDDWLVLSTLSQALFMTVFVVEVFCIGLSYSPINWLALLGAVLVLAPLLQRFRQRIYRCFGFDE